MGRNSFSSESELSQPESHGGSGADSANVGCPDIDVFDEAPALCEAAVETNEELALGGWGSGANVVRRVSHPSGLRLRSRSPRPLTSVGGGRRGTGRSRCRPLRGETRLDSVREFVLESDGEGFDQAKDGIISM